MYGITDFTRRFPEVLPADTVYSMNQRDFVDYCREQLWNKIAREEYGEDFDSLPFNKQSNIDLKALFRLANVFNEIEREKAGQQT